MKKGFKKAIASMLAVTMVLGTSIVSFAGDATPSEGVSNNTTLTASGNFEGHVDKNVVNVTLPTVAADNYNFIIDPEGLISATSGARYENAIFSSTTGVYFPTSVADGKTTYTNESVQGTVTNKSSVSVNVTMSIELTDLNSSIKTVSESAVNTGTDANLWLAVTDGTIKEEVVGTKASLTKEIAGTAGNYVVSWNAAKDTYLYVIDPAKDAGWQTATLYLQGACNTNGDWSASGLSKESIVQVTWKYEAVGNGLTVSTESRSVVISDAPSGTLKSVQLFKADGTVAALVSGTHYTYNATTKTFTVVKDSLFANTGATFELTYSTGEKVLVKIVAP